MGRRVFLEVFLEIQIEDEQAVTDQALAHFRAIDWSDDPTGEQLAKVEESVRLNPDSAGLQNLIRPKRLLDGIEGVTAGRASVYVRERNPGERFPFE